MLKAPLSWKGEDERGTPKFPLPLASALWASFKVPILFLFVLWLRCLYLPPLLDCNGLGSRSRFS